MKYKVPKDIQEVLDMGGADPSWFTGKKWKGRDWRREVAMAAEHKRRESLEADHAFRTLAESWPGPAHRYEVTEPAEVAQGEGVVSQAVSETMPDVGVVPSAGAGSVGVESGGASGSPDVAGAGAGLAMQVQAEAVDNEQCEYEVIMGRTGKIGLLPQGVREELNRRIRENEVSGKELVAWLNGLPEVRRVCAELFKGRAINEPNLCHWKEFGYREWWSRQEFYSVVKTLVEGSKELLELVKESPESLGDMLAVALSSRYAELLSFADDPSDERFQRRLQDLRLICMDIVRLRRGDHTLAKLSLAKAKAAGKARMEDRRLRMEGAERPL